MWLTNTLNGSGDNRIIIVRVRVNSPLTDTTILNNRVVVSAQEAPPYTTTQQTLVVAPRLRTHQVGWTDDTHGEQPVDLHVAVHQQRIQLCRQHDHYRCPAGEHLVRAV